LRVNVRKGSCGLDEDSDIMIDQIRVIEHKPLLRKIGFLSSDLQEMVKENIRTVLDID